MKRYELVLRDRSGRAGRFRSLKFLSRAVIFRHAEPGTRFSLRTDSCSEWHGAGQAQDARAQYRGPCRKLYTRTYR